MTYTRYIQKLILSTTAILAFVLVTFAQAVGQATPVESEDGAREAATSSSLVPAPLVSFYDGFNRADGPPGNGWSSYGVASQILNHELETFGQNHLGGGVSRTLPVNFPEAFSFNFRTDAPSDGGWWIGFNASTPTDVFYKTSEVGLYQASGSRQVCVAYQTSGGPATQCQNLVNGQRDYQSSVIAEISGVINVDFSATVTIQYNDKMQPPAVTIQVPAPTGALTAPLGNLLLVGNANLSRGPHFFDNVATVRIGNGVDFSHSSGNGSDEIWRSMVNAGVKFVVVQTWSCAKNKKTDKIECGVHKQAQNQLLGAQKKKNHLVTGAYVLLSYEQGYTGSFQVTQGLNSIKKALGELKLVVIDVELIGEVLPRDPRPRINLITDAVSAIPAGKKVAIYTSQGFWKELTGTGMKGDGGDGCNNNQTNNCSNLIALPLWDSEHRKALCGDGILGLAPFTAYPPSGWQSRLGNQFDYGQPPDCNGNAFFGIQADDVDLDFFDPALFQ